MKFTIKTFNEILNNMANWVKSNSKDLSNFRPGSVIRTILESVALEIELLYYKMYKGFNTAIQESIFNSFNFKKASSISSRGEITITFREPLTQATVIPKGFKFSTVPTYWDVVTFETIQEITCEPGIGGITVEVVCTKPGLIGNIPEGLVTTIPNRLMVMDSVVNNKPMVGGAPEESLEERKKRFTHYIQTLAKGTLSAVHYGCLSVPGVAGAYVDEHVGYLEIYAHDVNGNLPEELRKEIEIALIEYRSAGIEVMIKPVEILGIDLVVTVTLAPEVPQSKVGEYEDMVAESLREYLNSYGVARNLLRADLIMFIRSISSSLIINAELNLQQDLVISTKELIRAGDIVVNAHI